MKEAKFNILKKEYDAFEISLLKRIKNINKNFFTQNNEDCYIIEESWYNELSKFFTSHNNSSKIPFPRNLSIFISDFKCIIEHLKNRKKFKLINKKLIELLYRNENKLKNIPIIKYYSGNNKIILEYKEKKDDKALLFIDPLNQFAIINRTYIISYKNEDKLNLYNDLLSEENNYNIISKQKYKNFVISFQNYLNNNFTQLSSQTQNDLYSINNNQNNNDESFKKGIIEILVYIFYNQKFLNDKKEKIFNENNSYYLISTEWLNKFLEYYDYSKLNQFLINFSKSYPITNINDLTKYIFNYVGDIYKRNLINFEKEKNEEISNAQKLFAQLNKINDIFHFKECNIFINQKIISLLNQYIFQNKIETNFKKSIHIKNKDIYFYDFENNSIIIGNLNKELFIPKYIISYDTNEALKSEKGIFPSNEIADYIKSRNCEINNNNKIQNLINNNKIIGKLICLMNTISENKTKFEKISNVKQRILNHTIKPRKKHKDENNLRRYSINNLTLKKNNQQQHTLNLTKLNNDFQSLNNENNEISIKTLLLKDQENTSKLNNYEKKIKEQQNEINNLCQKNKQLNNEIETLKKSKLNEEKNNELKINEILKENDNKIMELEKTNSDKQKELEYLKDEFDLIQNELKDTKEKVITIQKEKNNLINNNREKDIQIENLKKENFLIKKEIEKLKERMHDEKENKLEEKKDNILINNDKLQNNNIKIEDLLEENKSLKESINNNKIEFDNLFAKLKNQLLDIKQGLNKESQLKEYNDLKIENLSLNYILKEKINEIDTLNIKINFMYKEKKYLEIQKREIENREKELQQKYNLLNQERNEFENKKKEFEKKRK